MGKSVGTRAGGMNGRAHWSVVLLATASGAVDALALTALGHVFAGVMTGNLVLLGVAAGADGESGVPALVSLGGYATGTVLATRLCRGGERTSHGLGLGAGPGPLGAGASGWPPRVMLCLYLETLALAGFAGVAGALSGHPEGMWRPLLLLAASGAMGAQSAAMLAGGSRTAPSTYFTGTLTVFFARLAGRERPVEWWSGARLLAVAVGAACAVGLRALAAPLAFALPAVALAAALACQGSGPWRFRTPAAE
ncbi:YoaK family protein [Streptomyces axinellae]|uniref:DUF1275 domain-containing protein n=1 Tax=Streptomyces axinellae TaxID=552788 RepID=A0ABN3PN06_9ACTN